MYENAKIRSINISEKKGTLKYPVKNVLITGDGLEADAHAGPGIAQVSLLDGDAIDAFSARTGQDFKPGQFGENLTTAGADLSFVKPLDKILLGDESQLLVTRIGKKCHGSTCAIFRQVGKCIMPDLGIFARVQIPGPVKTGDRLSVIPKIFNTTVITSSDRASAGQYEDASGAAAAAIIEKFFETMGRECKISRAILPDDPRAIAGALEKARMDGADLVLVTGGTGIGPRDITPEVVNDACDRIIPGIMEAVRMRYADKFPNALLSRSTAGVMGSTLVYAMPGSVRAVKQYLEVITVTLKHALYMVHGLGH